MRKLLVVSPLLLVLGAGCGATRRDFTYCDQKYHDCLKGFTCDLTQGLCVPETDAGAPDAVSSEVGTKLDVAPGIDLGSDAKDAPVVLDGNVIDTSIVDVNPVVDLLTPDLRVPDAAGTCLVDNDCTGAAARNCVNNRCVACKTSSQCNNAAGLPFCSAQNTCVSCASAGAGSVDGGIDGGIDGGVSAVCSGAIPVCNSATGSCVQCVKNTDCPTPGKAFCVQNQCVGCDTVGASAGSVDGGVTDAGASAPACTGATPVCVPSANGGPKVGQCVACNPDNGNRDCSGNTPICDDTTYTCKPCTSDSQCTTAPGICMLHSGGRCATDAETIYVNNVGGCLSTGTSTSATPFCQLQTGLNAVKADKRVIVVKGSSALLPFSADLGAGTPQVSIIGQNNPIILVGAASAGIELITGNLYLRGLTVQGAGNASANGFGIQVDSTASLIALDRCVVNGNRGGMLINDGPGFDIVNSIFSQNRAGSAGAALFGGVYLGNPSSTSAIHRFWFNTVADNEQLGVTCSVKGQNLDACLLADTSGEVVNCTLTKWTKSSTTSPTGVAGAGFTTDNSPPLFSSAKPYHLTATSPCKGFITDTTVAFPPDDVDGEARPNGTAADCGADEYWP
jgi:hypothetical protein